MVVGWHLNTICVEGTHAISTESTEKEAEFEHHVLSCPIPLLFAGRRQCPTSIVGREEDYGKRDVRMIHELFDDRTALIRLLTQNSYWQS